MKYNRLSISVCLATYNGEKYIKDQIDSILSQLNPNDELLIIDDCSKDDTVILINSYLPDVRIKLLINDTNLGHVQTFHKLIKLASKEIIFLSDQDDIWIDNRVDLMINKLESSNKMLLSSNSFFVDSFGNSTFFKCKRLLELQSNSYCRNILEIFLGIPNYYGCSMAFRNSFKNIILPIPNYVESHDLWIAMAANLYSSNIHLENETFIRRIHGSNASVINRTFLKKVLSRIIFVYSFFNLFLKIKLCQKKNIKSAQKL